MTESRIVDDAAGIATMLAETRRIAVLGMKTEAQADQPAFYVPKWMADHGWEIVPVPVYYPEVTTILGKPVYRKLTEVPGPIDMVDVFRRARDLDAHEADVIAAKPKFVWLQQGIKNDAFAGRLVAAGITVVQNRCLMVEARMWQARS